ncbi:MaoC/PaaZ C-terminal domain-containing protein [Pigmentiphaga sp. GD03639]|uniref:MaoC family dehydratase n=1 Tax=unclassified Pigmentiphaga TaxID=2626614 RepID=UPI000A550281|nr:MULTISPECIES: MaoC/PaaZ C-terminal domain-containing protein [unclassified Pigmentiphaga]MBN8838772.1 MaoC family dehydratase N-terminal domain-containing protein [Sphingomonadales bacterium]MBN9472695.1 MaoC family dehydratase N-terminal domain-containing protein [Burkholderiales bacterium]MDH2237142.1 MaoC/PaaZ C-terminal domain-containing protein [Pigmentiphaga sp. GD03639]OVZ65805.1 acyl dehydratase [Pigmentiphaga sp. NML030171]
MSEEDIPTVGLGLYFEDLPLGRKFKTLGRTVQDADICAFINVIHMTEVLFTDMEFVRNESDIKGRIAPGAFIYGMAEGLLAQSTMQKTGYAFINMELTVHSPVFAGDTLHVECEVIESRRSNSRPGRALVRTRNKVVKQDGTVALTYTPLRMLKCRDAAR